MDSGLKLVKLAFGLHFKLRIHGQSSLFSIKICRFSLNLWIWTKPHFCLSLQESNIKLGFYVKQKTTFLKGNPCIFETLLADVCQCAFKHVHYLLKSSKAKSMEPHWQGVTICSPITEVKQPWAQSILRWVTIQDTVLVAKDVIVTCYVPLWLMSYEHTRAS